MFKANIETKLALPNETVITRTNTTEIRSTEFPRVNEVSGGTSGGLKSVKLIYDDTANKIKDQNNKILTFNDIYSLTTDNTNLVTVNYSNVIYRLVFFDGSAIEFSNTYLYNGTEWTGRIIINVENNVKFDEIPFTVYSADEMVVGQWIDGKPLYRRLYKGDALIGQIIDPDFKPSKYTMIRAYGTLTYNTGNRIACPDANCSIITTEQRGLWFDAAGRVSDDNNCLFVEYTKNTD